MYVETIVYRALENLDAKELYKLDEKSIYSDSYKHEIIESFQKLFDKLKSRGLKNLIIRNSECKYCYPHGNAYSFHHPETDEFIIRYVIAYDGETAEGESLYRVEECRNNPIPEDFFERLKTNEHE